MFFVYIRKKYFNITFFIIAVIGAYWLYSSLKPTDTTNMADFYKYNYFKPLSKTEFIYFNLTNDYKGGKTIAYYKPKKEKGLWGIYTKELNDIEKDYFLYVIKKINPYFDIYEKMNDVNINISYAKINLYLKELEKKLNVRSFYYAGMNSPIYYVNGYKCSNSPYHIYKECTKRFHGKRYKDALKDFTLTYQHGISNGYSYLALDNLGLIIGLFAILYSFRFYSEEKAAKINEYIYTGNVSSVKFVLCQYLATVTILMFLSIVYIVFEAACFIHWNKLFNYGYNISIVPFLKQTPSIIFPSILIITAIGHFIGVLFQSEIVTAIIQFLLYYASIASVPNHKFSLNLIVRYSDFDDYSFYKSYFDYILINRIIVIMFSAILMVLTVKIFNYRREHSRLIEFKTANNIKLYRILKNIVYHNYSQSYNITKKGQKKNNIYTRNFGYYIFRQAIDKSVLLYIPYLCLMYPFIIYSDMNVLGIATVGENIIIFASLFLFIRLGNIEKNYDMESYVYTSNSFYPFIYMSRVILVCVVLFVMVELPVLFLCIINHASVGKWCIGVYLSSLFLGVFSLLITEFFENYFVGYFSYIIYYFFSVILKTMPLSVTGYTNMISKSKRDIGIATIVIFIILLIITYAKSKGIRMVRKNGNRN